MLTNSTIKTISSAIPKTPYGTSSIQKTVNNIAAGWRRVNYSTQENKILKKIQELSSKYQTEIKTLKLKDSNVDFIVFKGSNSGSNQGYWAQRRGVNELYYIKFPSAGEGHARSEQIASKLYGLAGVETAKTAIISDAGKIGIISKYLPYDSLPTIADASLLRKGFAADCWLANWDALKSGNVVLKDGKAVRLDVGGALCYRARGGLKGNQFSQDVPELTSFFESYSLSKPYLQNMTRDELLESLSNVALIKDKQIKNIIDNASYSIQEGILPVAIHNQNGTVTYKYNCYVRGETLKNSGIQNPEYLKEMLIERKRYITAFYHECFNTPQKAGENIAEYIKRIDSQIPKTKYKLPFDKIKMSTRVKAGNHTYGETLTPSQKRMYDSSYNAYLDSRKKQISHTNANNILTTDAMLHSTSPQNFSEILDKGITTGELRPVSQSGTGVETLTPLCADFWDIHKTSTIKEYFSKPAHEFAPGELNFLPRKGDSSMVIVVNKKAVDPTIMENSFKVNRDLRPGMLDTVFDLDGNMGGHIDYITHRAIPFGVPANAIDRIIVDKDKYLPVIPKMKSMIKEKGLDIKLYDLEGNLL